MDSKYLNNNTCKVILHPILIPTDPIDGYEFDPIAIEPIMMGALFHNYKTLLKLSGADKLNEDSILKQVTQWEKDKPLTKALFDKNL